jgi:hypothetical protein
MSNTINEGKVTKTPCIWDCGKGVMVLKPYHIIGTGVTKSWAHCNNCFQTTSYYPTEKDLLDHIKAAA